VNEELFQAIMKRKDAIIAELFEGRACYGTTDFDDIETVDGSMCGVLFFLIPGVRHSGITFDIPFEARHLNDNSIDYFVFYDPERPDSLSWKTGGEVRSRVPEEIRLLGTESKEQYSIELHFHAEEDPAA
jgi:hypothetical protein